MPAPKPPFVFLDRDGVINRDSAEYIRSVAEWQPLPGSLEAIARLTQAGFRCIVVSNQSGVGRGLFSLTTLDAIHRHMRAAVAAAGGEIAGIYFCPHRPDEGCECRKPRPGLLRQAAADFGIALEGVPFIGDKASDVEAALAVGARPVLVGDGTGRRAGSRDSLTERDAATDGQAVGAAPAPTPAPAPAPAVAPTAAAVERYPDLAAAADALIAARSRPA